MAPEGGRGVEGSSRLPRRERPDHGCLGAASDAAEELHDEQQQAAEILKDRVPPAPELPEAEPKGETKPPLFDSEVDFVTATRQLIRHKKLLGSDDGDLEENEEHIRDRGDES